MKMLEGYHCFVTASRVYDSGMKRVLTAVLRKPFLKKVYVYINQERGSEL